MTVVLFMLKIIGIVILVVLALVLLILAAVLFVPWRYRVCAELGEENRNSSDLPKQSKAKSVKSDDSCLSEDRSSPISVLARLHWLLHIVGVEVTYRDGQLDAYLRIFLWHKKLLNNEEAQEGEEKFEEDAKTAAEDAAEEAVKPKGEEKSKEDAKSTAEDTAEETVKPPEDTNPGEQEKNLLENTDLGDSNKDSQEKTDEKEQQKPVDTEEENQHESSDAAESGESLKTAQAKENPNKKSGGIIAHLKKIWSDFSNFRKKVTRMVEDEGNHRAVAHLKAELTRLLQAIRPRKLSIHLKFSLGSPDLTGEVLGVCAWFPIFYRSGNQLTPDFEADKAYAEGDVDAKGRIYLFQIAAMILRVLFDKDCKRMYRMFKKYF